ncbi:hypothetical protein LBMAG40_00040 [Cyanobium sp.]|nr:hypothetical protein LBMAG40_00040 [Cyanobium sp.]
MAGKVWRGTIWTGNAGVAWHDDARFGPAWKGTAGKATTGQDWNAWARQAWLRKARPGQFWQARRGQAWKFRHGWLGVVGLGQGTAGKASWAPLAGHGRRGNKGMAGSGVAGCCRHD